MDSGTDDSKKASFLGWKTPEQNSTDLLGKQFITEIIGNLLKSINPLKSKLD